MKKNFHSEKGSITSESTDTLENQEPFKILPPKRIKPLAEVTWADVPPGFDPEDVATDVPLRR